MKLMNFKCSIALILGVLLTMTTLSCQDEELGYQDENVVEGLPATLDLKLSLSDMPEMTRSVLDDERSNNCENLWVGIYLKESGKCIYNNLFTDPADYQEKLNTQYDLELTGLQTMSGKVYIVAAANVNSVYAIPTPKSPLTEEALLGTLLQSADTWEKFTGICALRSESSDISQLSYEFPMSGFYMTSADEDDDLDSYSLPNIQAVVLKEGQNTLTGVIKLRRLISYNKFNISAGPNITLKLVSWQVFNNPYYSYVLDSEHNAGDDSFDESGSTSAYNPSVKSTVFAPGDDDSDGFEFFQFENKHTACTYDKATDWVGIRDPEIVSGLTVDDMYNDREREYKALNGSTGYYDNSGVYKSLVNDRSSISSMAHNYASYVVLTAQVSYYVNKPSEALIASDADDASLKYAEPVEYTEENKANLIYRTAEVKYVIHLGYCEGKNGDTPTYKTAQDFNCRRNSKYLYNIKINGVKNIVVEAHREGEIQSGAEGTVYDAFGEYVQLDAHYNTFNIKLTNNERKTLKYNIIAPYNGTNNYIYSDNINSTNLNEYKANQFYKWITFRPTTSESVLAPYPGENSDKLWTLYELHDVENHSHSENLDPTAAAAAGESTAGDDDDQWYTVFIDENVYHDGEVYHEATNSYTESNWVDYVNQDDRKVELIVRSKESEDNQSVYLLCKYAFSQRSIQSYYKMVDVVKATTRAEEHDTDTALGLEHTNESFCLNLRWDENIKTDLKEKHICYDNGRYNLWYACCYGNMQGTQNRWENVIQETVPEHILEGTCSKTLWSHPEAYYPVPKLKAVSTSISSGGYDPTPNDATFYNVNTACMNRNRDLNGDGIIDESEMKWYNPTYNEYVQIQIGLAGLVSPTIDWYLYAEDRFYIDTKGNEFLHYACSDRAVIWVEEGYSVGRNILYTSGGLYPYEIRCARHLGGNPGNEPTTENEIQPAYVQRSDDPSSEDYYIIDAPYYTDACVRPYSAAAIGPNEVNSELNKVYRHFQVSKDFCKDFGQVDDNFQILSSGHLYMAGNSGHGMYQKRSNAWRASLKTNSICKNYTQEEGKGDLGSWRVPNIKELTMMQLLGFTAGVTKILSSTNEYFYNFEFTDDSYESKKAFFGQLSAQQISRSVLSGTNVADMDVWTRCVRDLRN